LISDCVVLVEPRHNLAGEELKRYPGKGDTNSFYLYKKKNSGGFLTHSSILNLTSDEVTTNPILRGVWIMRKYLGIPLREPPPVPAFEPDLRSAKSKKEQIEIHKTNKSCAACHVYIDPFGLALEKYDNIGSFREKYKNRREIKVDEELADTAIQGLQDLKEVILEHYKDIYVMNFAEKLLEYLLRRKVENREYYELYNIVNKLKGERYPIKTMLISIIGHSSLVSWRGY